MTRRDALKAGGVMAGTALVTGTAAAEAAGEESSRKRTLRLAHLTDVHVQPELAAGHGMAACLHHVQSLADKPDVILSGGDSIMDSFAEDRTRTELQWKLWHSVLADECSLPLESCIGNHDIWGWDKKKSGATGSEDLYGKKWALDALKLESRYRSFQRGGWHFVVLDSTFPGPEPDAYVGRLDEEQFAWLACDLSAVPVGRPVCVLSHIPILSAAAFFDGENEKEGDWKVPASWMHIDARRIKDLFLKHPGVRLCVSGHLHLVDRVDYNGVTYLCNGAVSGNWWKGDNQECDEGYCLIDLYDNGTFKHEYVGFGWQPRS